MSKKETYSEIFSDIMKFLKDAESKEESSDIKKAIDYLNHQEIHFTNLEKSDNGKWIEKAGFGLGTVRVWRGKKYKKISNNPTRWVRVYDKTDRGAKSAMTRLIHKAAQYKDDPEGMMKFLLENKQRFYNEDQKRYIDLVDRLNAFIDSADYNKTKAETKTSKPKETKEENYWITDIKGNRLTNEDAKKKIKNNLSVIDGYAESLQEAKKEGDKASEIKLNSLIERLEDENKYLIDRLKADDRSEIKAESTLHYNSNVKAPSDESEKNRTERIEQNKKDKDFESESEKHQNRSNAMKGNKNAWKGLSEDEKNKKISAYAAALLDYSAKDYENLKTQIKEGKTGLLGGGDDIPKEERIKVLDKLLESEKEADKTKSDNLVKLSADNQKSFNVYADKFQDEKRNILRYPSEVEIDGEKKLAYTNGQFLVVTHDIPNEVKTKQSEKIEGNYPNVERVIPKEFRDNSAPKIDINIDQVMKDLPKVDFSKKAFNDDSHKQYMKIGNFWYDAKQIKATYDMLKGNNAEIFESKDTYSNGRFGRLCIKTDKGYSVIVSSSNDYAENYKKQAIYNSDEGSMSASAKADYESKKKTGLPDTYVNNAVNFGYQIDNKGFIHGEDKEITFKGKGENTEFYYNGIPTGIKNRSSYMYGTKENIQSRVDAVKVQIEKNIESYKEGKKNPAKKPSNYDATFPNMTDKDLTDIYKWWSNPKNIEEAIYKNSYKTKVPGLGSYGNDARKIGVVEDSVMDMLPDIKKEIARRGITIKKSLDGEMIFETSLQRYIKKSLLILNKY